MIGKQLRKWWPAVMLTAISLQPAVAQESEKAFSGKPVLTLFSNYKAGLGHKNENSGFNLDRTFVGYEGFFTKGFSAKILMNVETVADENGKTKFNGYLKNAQIDWKGNGFFVSAGLVNLRQFSEQENFWGHRYIFKSFQEEYGIAFCEDIGVVAGYEFSPVISADLALTNGEGRKFKNMDNKYKYGAGITSKPAKGFMFRIYGDIYNTPEYLKTDAGVQKDQYSVAAFAGYSNSRFSLGVEYNRAFNYKFSSGTDVNGYSVYTTVNIARKIHLFGRFDLLDATDERTNNVTEGHTIIGGFEYSPIRQVRISPNYQSWKARNGRRENYLLLSVECKI